MMTHIGRAAPQALALALFMAWSAAAMAQPVMVIPGSQLIPSDDIPPGLAERGVVRQATLVLPQNFLMVPPGPGVSDPVGIPIDAGRVVGLVEKNRRDVGSKVYVTGEVADVPHSQFSIVIEDGTAKRGQIRLHNEIITLGLLEKTATQIRMHMVTVEPSQLPENAEPFERTLPDPPPGGPGIVSLSTQRVFELEQGTPPTNVKVLVVYSEAARNEVETFFFGTVTIEELIDDTVFLSNFHFEQHAKITLELVHMEQVNYKETGNIFTDLERLACPCDHKLKGIGDNHLNEVFDPWKTHEADLVSLWLDYPLDPGLANIMTTVSPNFAPFAVSVVDWGAAFFTYSFEHEIGHNFGARHDRIHDNTNGSPYLFNHGYANLLEEKVTIMSYRKACPPGMTCDRVAVWSNPDHPPAGQWGIASGINAADNALTLRQSKGTVSQFFEQGEGWIGCCIRSGGIFNRSYRPGYCP